ncbi:MAG: MFS transporter [Methanocorpusculum sp.]|nr:MFS transporter [Methanocorpusculum sp.]
MRPELKKVLPLAAGHGAVDFYMPIASALLPSLIPLFEAQGISSYIMSGLLFGILSIAQMIFEPLFGALTDKNRWIPGLTLCCITTAVAVSMFAVTQNYWILLACALINGIMNSAFHPNAYAQIHQFTTAGNRGKIMSIMSVGGSFGYGAAPLLTGFLYAAGGWTALLFLLIPGIAVGLLLLKSPQRPKPDMDAKKKQSGEKANRKAAVVLLAISSLRCWVYYGFIGFGVVYLTTFAEVEYVAATGAVSCMLFAGMLGTLSAGYLSDKIGRKEVMIISYLCGGAAYLCIFFFSGAAAVTALLIASFFLMATASVEIAAVQEVMPDSVGLASGVVIGIPQGVTAAALAAVGALAAAPSLAFALPLQTILMAAAVILSIFLPYPLRLLRRRTAD